MASNPLNLSASLESQVARAGVNQIRGNNVAGTTGAGIPKQVTNVAATVARASAGTTSTVTVTFHRDPTDKSFSGATIFVKGYQGNQTPTQIASGSDSPVQFILNNTGEAVSIIVQAFGNSGAAALPSCPTTGVQLPKSSAGGVGTTTKTSSPATSGSASAGQLAKFANPATTVTGADLTGDATTSGSVAVTVKGLQGKSVSANTPIEGDQLWFNGTGWEPNWYPHIKSWSYNLGAGTFSWLNQATGQLTSGGTDTAPTATEPASYKASTSATASLAAFGLSTNVDGVVLGLIKRWQCRARANNTSNARYWVGFTSKTSPISVTTLAADDPASTSMCAFRFSAGVDTHWQAITSNGSTQTIVDTGVAPDTSNSQLFEISFDGTNVYFFINRTQVAKISTTLPSTSVVLVSANTVDNKDTANAVSIQLYYGFYQEK